MVEEQRPEEVQRWTAKRRAAGGRGGAPNGAWLAKAWNALP
jgi:hypothetical protein